MTHMWRYVMARFRFHVSLREGSREFRAQGFQARHDNPRKGWTPTSAPDFDKPPSI